MFNRTNKVKTQLKNYIKDMTQMGVDEEAIIKKIVDKGWSEEIVRKLISEVRERKIIKIPIFKKPSQPEIIEQKNSNNKHSCFHS